MFLTGLWQEEFATSFLDGDADQGFLHKAVVIAGKAAQDVLSSTLSVDVKGVKKNKKVDVKTHVKSVKKDTKIQRPWWQKLGAKKPISGWFEEDQKKGLTMSAKNFASRCYKKIERKLGREAARKAHADALEYARS